MINELIPFSQRAYAELGAELNISTIEQNNIIDFFPTPQMKLAFHQRYKEDQEYLSIPTDLMKWKYSFNDDFGFGEINPCFLVNIAGILSVYRKQLAEQIHEEKFEMNFLQIEKEIIRYKDITADSIIFCDGAAGADNPYFHSLPFAPNKGEVLWIECKDLPATNIFKKGINLVPLKEDIFWVGSSYQWEFTDSYPTLSFRVKTIAHLEDWLKLPFKVLDHRASVRPATLERRPFIGFHPSHKNIGMFNGMGTKGCSLSPFLAKKFVDHIVDGEPLPVDVDILRFRNILTKHSQSTS